jgi:arylsulfatase A-like enzyme
VATAAATRGTQVDRFTEHVDVMPTLLTLAGLAPPRACDGHSLTPFLEGRTPPRWRTAARFEYDFRDVVSGKPETALGLTLDECVLNVTRGDRWKYVHFANLPPLLFDLARDPGELTNLAADPTHEAQLLAGAQDLLSWRMRHDERTLTGIQITDEGPVSRP